MTQPEYRVFQNAEADKFGRYERWGWAADKVGCGGGYASSEMAEAAAQQAVAESKSDKAIFHGSTKFGANGQPYNHREWHFRSFEGVLAWCDREGLSAAGQDGTLGHIFQDTGGSQYRAVGTLSGGYKVEPIYTQ